MACSARIGIRSATATKLLHRHLITLRCRTCLQRLSSRIQLLAWLLHRLERVGYGEQLAARQIAADGYEHAIVPRPQMR
jgi:hypothetical protein